MTPVKRGSQNIELDKAETAEIEDLLDRVILKFVAANQRAPTQLLVAVGSMEWARFGDRSCGTIHGLKITVS